MDTSAASPENHADKKAYRSPRLVAYGSIAKLTQGGTGSFMDFAAMQMTPCL